MAKRIAYFIGDIKNGKPISSYNNIPQVVKGSRRIIRPSSVTSLGRNNRFVSLGVVNHNVSVTVRPQSARIRTNPEDNNKLTSLSFHHKQEKTSEKELVSSQKLLNEETVRKMVEKRIGESTHYPKIVGSSKKFHNVTKD